MIKTVNELPKDSYETKEKFQSNLPWIFGSLSDTAFTDSTASYSTAGDCLRYVSSDLQPVGREFEDCRSAIRFERPSLDMRGLHRRLATLKSLKDGIYEARSRDFRDSWKKHVNSPDLVQQQLHWFRKDEGKVFKKAIYRYVKTGKSKLEERWVHLKPRTVTWVTRQVTWVKLKDGTLKRNVRKVPQSKVVTPFVRRIVVVPIKERRLIRPAGMYTKWTRWRETVTVRDWQRIRDRYNRDRHAIEARYAPRLEAIVKEQQDIERVLAMYLNAPKRMVAYTTHGCVGDPLEDNVRVPRMKLMHDVISGLSVYSGNLGQLPFSGTTAGELRNLFEFGGWGGVLETEDRVVNGLHKWVKFQGGKYVATVLNPFMPTKSFSIQNGEDAVDRWIRDCSVPSHLAWTYTTTEPAVLPVRGDSITVTNEPTAANPADMRDDAALGSQVAMFEALTDRSDYTFHYVRSMGEATENADLIPQGLTVRNLKRLATPREFFKWLKGKSIKALREFSNLPIAKKLGKGSRMAAGLYLIEKFAIEPTVADCNTLLNGVYDDLVITRKALHKLLTDSVVPSNISILHHRKRFKGEDYGQRNQFDSVKMPEGIWSRYKSVELNLVTSIDTRPKVTCYSTPDCKYAAEEYLQDLAQREGSANLDVDLTPREMTISPLDGGYFRIDMPYSGTSVSADIKTPKKSLSFQSTMGHSAGQLTIAGQGRAVDTPTHWDWTTYEDGEAPFHVDNPYPEVLKDFHFSLSSTDCQFTGMTADTVAENLSGLVPEEALPVPILCKNEVHGVIFGQYMAEDLLRLMGIKESRSVNKTTDEMDMWDLLTMYDDVIDNFFERLDFVFVAWELFPLSFVFDWFMNSHDIALRLNALLQGTQITAMPRSQYGTWVTKKCELYAGAPEYTCYEYSVWRHYTDWCKIRLPGSYVRRMVATPTRAEVTQVWRFKPKTGDTVSLSPSGLKKAVRGPYSADALSILRESIPLLQIKLDSGKLRTLAALLLN